MAGAVFQLLTMPPSLEVVEQAVHPDLWRWFARTFGEPTKAQRFAWPAIQTGGHFLLASPTGTGKTLAAFLPILSHLLASPTDGLQCLYLAPLKALSRDIAVSLKKAWRSIRDAGFFPEADLRVGLRTGDTTQRVRRRHLRHPPAILATTPESLAQMLAHPPTHDLLRTLRWIIVDEVHAMMGNKRGADLAVSLERVDRLKEKPAARIGLSATCTPLEKVAEFLAGPGRTCTAAHVADETEKRLVVEPLFESLTYSPGWVNTLLDRLEPELAAHRTTLIFTNTRNLAERLTWALRRRYPDRREDIAAHHSSISAVRRRVVERRLKHGQLWTVVSSTSLELGIDIGTVDHVVFVHPPGGVVRLLQRVGRSGHRPEEPRRGLLLTASPGELLEATVTASSGRDGQIEAVRTCTAPLDVLCQQLVGMAITRAWTADEAFALIRSAAPFQDLSRGDFDDCLDYLSGRRRDGSAWLPPRLGWQGDRFTIVDSRTAKLLRRNLGTILTEDPCAIHLRDSTAEEPRRTKSVGEVDLAYAERLQPGDRFVLDGRCLELKERERGTLLVDEVFGRPQVPRWIGTGVPMPRELALRIFIFRTQASEILRDGEAALVDWLGKEFALNASAGEALARYFHEQETRSEVPTLRSLLIESVSMQACSEFFLHTPLPRSANEVLARVLIHRWTHSGRRDVLALAADLGVYLLVPGENRLSPEAWRDSLSPAHFAENFRSWLASSEMLAQVFARVAQTGLMVLRNPLGGRRKVGGRDWTERQLFEQLRTSEPGFVLLRQAEREAHHALCDLDTAQAFVEQLASLPLHMRSLGQPSPFGESFLGGVGQQVAQEGG